MQPEHGLYTAEIRLTKACNLRCRHCSVSAGKKAEYELTTNEVRNIIDELSEMGVLYVVFTGGEPLLHKDLQSFVSHASSKGLKVSIDTNGTMLSKELARDLKKSGISTVQISLDGTREGHDFIRGRGSFDAAIQGIKNSLSEGIYTTINFTASKLNQSDLPELIELAKGLGVSSFSMERFSPMGRGSQIKEMTQTSKEFKKCLGTLLNAKGIRTNSTDPLSIFLKKDVLDSFAEEIDKNRICGGCTAGIAAITVSYDGEVYPCPKLEVSCGNTRDSTLLDIWLGSEVIKSLRYRRLKGVCGACDWKNICGGCRAVAEAVSGDYLADDPACFIEAGI